MDVNVLNGKNKGPTTINEYRYAKGIAYFKRVLAYFTDTVKGYGLEYLDLKYYYGYQKIAILYGLSTVKIKNSKVYRHFESVNNLQATESAKNFIDPNTLSIPTDRWITTLSPQVGDEIRQMKIEELGRLEFKHIYRDVNNIVISYLPQKNKNLL